VIVGEPNFFSITTLRPLGPSVAFTASARMFTPRKNRLTGFLTVQNLLCHSRILLGTVVRYPLSQCQSSASVLVARKARYARPARTYFFTIPRTSSSRMIRKFLTVELDLGARVLAEEDVVACLHIERKTLPSSFDLPLPTEMTSPSWGFSLALSG